MMKPPRLDDSLNGMLVVVALSLLAGLYLDVAGGSALSRDDAPAGAVLVTAPAPSANRLAEGGPLAADAAGGHCGGGDPASAQPAGAAPAPADGSGTACQ